MSLKSQQLPKRKRRPELRAAYWEAELDKARTVDDRFLVAVRWLQAEARRDNRLRMHYITEQILVTVRDVNRQQQEKSGSPSRAYTPLRA